jgi:FkbM family methyltransferase
MSDGAAGDGALFEGQSMNLMQRAARRVRRTVKKYARLRAAGRIGLVSVEPNFIYRPDLSSASVVVDGGCSYEADFSVHMMRRHGVRAFGVDPTRKHRDALQSLEKQYAGRFTHVPWAIAGADGVLTFHESRSNESGSLLDDHVNVTHDPTTSYDVEAVTLTSLLARLDVGRVDILKLDLEGAEYELLERATPEQLRPFGQIFVEFHHHAVPHFSEADTRRIVGLIAACGFQAFSLDDHNYLFYRAG